jgi:hypothetical protein
MDQGTKKFELRHLEASRVNRFRATGPNDHCFNFLNPTAPFDSLKRAERDQGLIFQFLTRLRYTRTGMLFNIPTFCSKISVFRKKIVLCQHIISTKGPADPMATFF